jgi:hypothetical protein
MSDPTRKQLTALVWRNTHPEKRGTLGRSKSVAVLRNRRRQHLPLESLPYPELFDLALLARRSACRTALRMLGYTMFLEAGSAEWAVAFGPDVDPAAVSLVTGEQIAIVGEPSGGSASGFSHESLMHRARAECGRRNS